MKLTIASDLHGEACRNEPFEVEGDVLVLAGDVDTAPIRVRNFISSLQTAKPIIYVLGNHEHDRYGVDEAIRTYRTALRRLHHVHVLERDNCRIGEVTFRGTTLWSNPVGQDQAIDALLVGFGMRSGSVNALRRSHQQSREWLSAAIGSKETTVIVTHSAPSARSQHPRFAESLISKFFYSDLDDLIRELRPALWVHGHMHDAVDYRIGSTRVFSNPRGYPGERASWSPQTISI